MAEIFLMEDSPALRRIYIAELREAGHNVTALENGSESHDGNFFDRADILVTDLEMPHVNGFEAVRNVRASHPGLPIVVITGLSIEATKDLPCNAVLRKPFCGQELIELIATYLEN